MSLFSKLFGGGGKPRGPDPVDYNGFSIIPDPMKDGPRWRIAATIEKDGRSHQLIRADTLDDHQAAADASLRKAKQMIDEQGERIFG